MNDPNVSVYTVQTYHIHAFGSCEIKDNILIKIAVVSAAACAMTNNSSLSNELAGNVAPLATDRFLVFVSAVFK